MGKNQLNKLSIDEIMNMDKQERVHFINSIGGFKSVGLIGTQNKEGKTNLAIIDSIVHIGSDPALFGFFSRPKAYERHTLENILETGFYTINHINENIYKQAHQTSARYEREVSEFEAANLTEAYKDNFLAPFIEKSNIQIAMEFKEQIDIKLNNTILVIGEVKAVYFPENCLQQDGFLDLEMAETITCSGLDSYHNTTKINRLSYAKPNKELISIG